MNKKLLTTLILCIFTFEPMCWADGQVRYSNHQNIKEKNVDVNDNLVEFIDNFYYYYDTYRYINFYVAKYNNKYALYANNNIILEPIYDNFDILIGDEINENKNILFIKERDTDFILCLDTEIEQNIKAKQQAKQEVQAQIAELQAKLKTM